MPNIHSFDMHNIVALLDPPASQASANSSWLDPFAEGDGAERAVFMLIVGALSSKTVDFALWQATDANGTGAKAIPGADINVIATSTGEIKTIEISPNALDLKNGYRYVQARVVVSDGGSEPYAVLLIRHGLRYPGTAAQDETYTEVVRVYNNGN